MAFEYLERVRREAVPVRDVLIATRDLDPGMSIESDAIEVRSIPEILLPVGVLTEPDQASGRLVTAPIYAQELIHPNRLSGSGSSGLAALLPQGSFAMIIPTSWFVSPIPELSSGERLDLLVYAPGEGLEGAGLLASEILVLDPGDQDENMDQLVVAVDLEQAKRLLFAHANGCLMVPLLPADEGGG
jgi:Flp pilus assembly protein CpaB